MHNHNSDRLLRGGAQADDRVARALLRTDGVLSRRCANNCRSFVVHTTSTGHVDQPAGGRRVASRRAACATLHAQRNRPHTHTHITARATHTPLAGAERLVQMYLRATVSTHACDAAARTQRGASSRSRVGAASGGVGARQAALRAQHKQDRRARATSYSQKNKHSHNHAIHRQMCGVTESRSFFQSRAR